MLSGKLTKNELAHLRSSYDIIGDIAILEIPRELIKKETIIANVVMAHTKHIRTVVKKAGIHTGQYRTQKLRVILGEKTTETVHKENAVSVRLDIAKVYFSPRLANERLRIAKLIKAGEKVLVMFSGVGVYPLVIAKNSKAAVIFGIEKNPVAHRYALENCKLNKLHNIVLHKGDVKAVVKTIDAHFDRIILPLPKGAHGFLREALAVSKRKCTLHYYTFGRLGDADAIAKTLRARIERLGRKCSIQEIVKCGQYAPRVYRLCIDLSIT